MNAAASQTKGLALNKKDGLTLNKKDGLTLNKKDGLALDNIDGIIIPPRICANGPCRNLAEPSGRCAACVDVDICPMKGCSRPGFVDDICQGCGFLLYCSDTEDCMDPDMRTNGACDSCYILDMDLAERYHKFWWAVKHRCLKPVILGGRCLTCKAKMPLCKYCQDFMIENHHCRSCKRWQISWAQLDPKERMRIIYATRLQIEREDD